MFIEMIRKHVLTYHLAKNSGANNLLTYLLQAQSCQYEA